MNKIKFASMYPGVKVPSKREEDGAFDVYAYFMEDYKVIKPSETVMIPTGLASAFSKDYVAILKERGSTGTKGIGQRAGVIDSGYRGQWFIPITNHNKVDLVISKDGTNHGYDDAIVYPYDKAICQVIMVPVPRLEIEEISMEELNSYKSERGTGMLGSSNK